MIILDANLLVYAHVAAFPQHGTARDWLEEQLAGTPRVGLPWPSLLAFVRLVTNPRVFSDPEALSMAWAQVERWLSAAPTWIPTAGPDHPRLLGECLQAPGLRANDVPDAHLAALAREHGLELATSDAGFARFASVRWFDPTS